MPQHTSTPWKTGMAEGHIYDEARGSAICRCFGTPRNRAFKAITVTQRDANAALIVRAVNSHERLLAALERLVSVDSLDHSEDWLQDHADACLEARAAIAAATPAPPPEHRSP